MKYKQGEFGYWWTITQGMEDIEGGDFHQSINCRDQGINSLKGCPRYVGNDFSCNNNNLETLEYGPEEIRSSFTCSNNKLINLKFGPKNVSLDYMCNNNELISCEGTPKIIGGEFDCGNNKLETLEFIPTIETGILYAENNTNIFLEMEYYIRKKHPDLNDKEIAQKLYEHTKNPIFLPKEVQEIFVF